MSQPYEGVVGSPPVSAADRSLATPLPFEETEHIVDGGRGIEIHAYDWGGTGPTLVLAHATGLHAHVWIPLVERLRASFRCIGVDLMAQGASSAPTDGNLSWDGVAAGLCAVLDHFGLSGRGDVYGIGHSQGGYAILESERRRSGTYASVFVHEPVVFPVPPGMKPGDTWPENHMAQLTIRRRRTFPSVEYAIANFMKKPPFGMCERSVVESYVRWGFEATGVVTDEGEEIGLLCSPETEAGLFSCSTTDIFENLGEITCRSTYGLGEEPGNFGEVVPRAAAATPNATLLRLPGRTHFGIIEGIDEMAVVVRDHLLGTAATSSTTADQG